MIDGVSYCTLCDTHRWVGWPLVSCLVMAPPVTRRAHSMRRLSGAELGTDTDRNDTRTGTPRNSLDGNGPGSTGGRSHGSSGVQQIPDMGHDANQRQDTRDDASGRFTGHNAHTQRAAGSGGSRFSRLSHADSNNHDDKHTSPHSANTTTHRLPTTGLSRSEPRFRGEVYDSDTNEPYLRPSQTAPRMQQPSVYDGDLRRATRQQDPRQDLFPLLRDAEPHAPVHRGDQGAVEANAPNAENSLLQLRLDSQQKMMEEMQARMDAMQR